MNSAEFLISYKTTRMKWDSMLATFKRGELVKPGIIPDISLKDLIAHMTWYEGQMLELLSSRILAGSELWNLENDERNLAIFEINKDRGVEEILAESEIVHKKLLEELGKLNDDDLINSCAFEGMPDDWIPWMMIAGNTFEHYQEHFNDLESWHSALNQ